MIPVLANVAVSVFFPQPVLMVGALVLVAAVEMLALRRPVGASYSQVLSANALSTLVGIPIALIWFAVFSGTLTQETCGWWTVDLLSRGSLADKDAWLILGFLRLGGLLPCFALSIYLEGRYLVRKMPIAPRRSFWLSVIKAHCYSYSVLLCLDLLWSTMKI
jgi:hypothetical protein